MRLMPIISCMALLLEVTPISAQVSLSPKAISKDFQGKVPYLWTVEGNGNLLQARFRIRDETGRPCGDWQEVTAAEWGSGRWRSVTLDQPSKMFQGMPIGIYSAQWEMTWKRDGKIRKEETEVPIRLQGAGDGWLQRAFMAEDLGAMSLQVPSAWPTGESLAIALTKASALRGVAYQLVSESDEKVIRTWTDLSVREGTTRWTLPGDKTWPQGMAYLWIRIEDGEGRVWVYSQEIQLGRVQSTGTMEQSQGTRTETAKSSPIVAPLAAAITAPTLAASTPNADWLAPLDDADPPNWEETNLVATVATSYRDDERNGGKLWPSPVGRPMSLSLTGSDGLGNPLYSVSYLLAPGSDLEESVNQALKVTTGTASLPAGASFLEVGKVLAPVIVSPGVVKDFLGKPLAAGYGFAIHTDGVPISAANWAKAPTKPLVGLNAIKQGAIYRAKVLQDSMNEVGYGGTDAYLGEDRDPYAITLTSQDPLGRTILGKALGSKHVATAAVMLKPDAQPLMTNFNSGIPSWTKLQSGATYGSGNIQLDPARVMTTTVMGTWKFQNTSGTGYTDNWSDDESIDAGSIYVDIGRMYSGASVSVSLTSAGPVRAYWFLDGVKSPTPVGGSGTWSGVAATRSLSATTASLGITAPVQLGLMLTNGTPALAKGVDATPDQIAYVDDLNISSDFGALGLKADPAFLANAVAPSQTRTQYGYVEISSPQMGRCTVTMVTDPDGSSVAEVKDPEGRTIYKIVNPTIKYTNLFKDYTGINLLPASPKIRGTAPGATVQAAQMDLLTQYVFDTQGHLRAVIPPKGTSGTTWGKALTDADLDAVLSDLTADFSSVATNAKVKAPYATFNAYDESGHLVATYNPDEGTTSFVVDQKGRVHYSQTESQRSRTGGPFWTRTLYDAIYRVLAVGEVQVNAPSDPETLPVYDPASSDFSSALLALSAPTRSQNTYDLYASDPLGSGMLPASVKALLPPNTLWGAFADGHLVLTSDANSTERYFYDQDGRIVIRWVTLTAGSKQRDFAIGIYYDFSGRVKRLVYPDGPGGDPLQVAYWYDDLGRLFSVGTPNDPTYFARYAYLPTGEVRAIVYGPGSGFAAKRMLQDPQGWLRDLTVQSR